MRRIAASQYRTMPWANGRGLTREIARRDPGGRLLWRLSLADVAEDGPFSAFPGLARILTVVEGAGMRLAGPALRLDARPWEPVHFSGDVALDGQLVAGPVRDLNLIFDPARLGPVPRILRGAARIEAAIETLLWLAEAGAAAPPLHPGDSAALAPGEALDLPEGASAVALELWPAR